MIVVDTNIIASLLLPSSAVPTAEALMRKDSGWTAPGIWRYEFKNVLATQIRVMGMQLEKAVSLFENAEELIIKPETEPNPGAVLLLAREKKLSAYDAEFVALAIALNVKLVTVDGGILKATTNIAVRPEVFIAS
jgi:predicted nucleic acid-binding protein